MRKPRVYIQRSAEEPMHEHCLAAWQGFNWLKYEVQFFDESTVGNIGLSRGEIPVVGSVEITQQYFKAQGRRVPDPLNIPPSLLPFAGRNIDRTTLGEFLDSYPLPAFVKPADTCKLWTGGVVSGKSAGRLLFSEYPTDTPVLASPEVDFESEYRVFVSRVSGIAGMKHYSGDPFITPCHSSVLQMIAAYKDAPRAYSLDVGIVNGLTVIVECNDFWALGTYGLDPVKYAELLAFRWHEMITTAA